MELEKHRVFDSGYAKTPAFAKVYEDLYLLITNGHYPENGVLPSENQLATQYGVSRNTLRQALAILCEDGLIYNVRGKGHFVSPADPVPAQGYERLTNTIFSAAIRDGIKTTLHYFFYPTAQVVQKKLNLLPSDIAIVANLEYTQNDTKVSYMFIEVPIKHLENLHIDLTSADEVESLLNQKIFEAAFSSQSRITLTQAEENIATYLDIELETPVLFIEEVLRDASGNGIALCKQYLIPSFYNIVFNRCTGKVSIA